MTDPGAAVPALSRLRSALGSQAAGQLVAMVAGMAAVALLAHTMHRGGYGRFLVAWSFVAIAGTLLRVGLSRTVARELPRQLAAGRRDMALRTAAAGWWLATAAALTLVLPVALAAAVLLPGLELGSWPIWLVAAAAALEALRVVGETMLRSLDRPVAAQVLGSPVRTVLFMAAAAVGLCVGATWSFDMALLVFLATNLVPVLALLAWQAATDRSGLPSLRPPAEIRPLLAAAPALTVLDLAAIVLTQGDVIVAGLALDAAEVAAYAVAVRVSVAFTLPALVINTAVTPRIAWLAETDGIAAARRLCRRLSWASLALTALGVALFAAIGRPVLDLLFGDAAEGAWRLGLVFGVAACIRSVVAFAGLILLVQRRDGIVTAVLVAAAVGEVVVGYPVALAQGPMGLALATAAASAFQVVVLALLARPSGHHHHSFSRGPRKV